MRNTYKVIANNLDKEEFEQFYMTHPVKQVAEKYSCSEGLVYAILEYFKIPRNNKQRHSYIMQTFNCTPERNAKVSNSNKGRIFPLEVRDKISSAQKGKKREGFSNNTTWKKGNVPWNKGLKGLQTWSDSLRQKYFNTLSSIGWYNKSSQEDYVYELLLYVYDITLIYRLHKDAVRYPFYCDFYIPELDLFIEYNGWWHHGPHPFDPTSEQDMNLLKEWKEKATTSKLYEEAINTWTVRDVKKFEFAKKYNLNYLAIYP